MGTVGGNTLGVTAQSSTDYHKQQGSILVSILVKEETVEQEQKFVLEQNFLQCYVTSYD